MDFTRKLSSFQGVIMSLDNVHPFSKITAKGGNEEKINFIVDSVRKFLEDNKYICNNVIVEETIYDIRKIILYIVLNADLPILEEMTEMEGIDSVIWTVPTIPKFLMSEMLWYLHMDKLVYEIICFCYPYLSLQVIEALLKNMKYFTPQESLSKIKLLSTACYRLICRMNFFTFVDTDTLSTKLIDAFNYFQECLNFFTSPPKVEKLNSLVKDEFHKYKAERFRSILLVVMECMGHFTAVEEFESYGFDTIYSSTHPEGSVLFEDLTFATNESTNKHILGCLNKCNQVLLDKCKEILMDIDVETFCSWSEFEENNKSLQLNIGEHSYNLREKLLNVDGLSKHPVVNMLAQFSHKPADYKDVVNHTDTVTILQLMEKSSEENALWTHALLYKEDLCYDDSLLEMVIENLELLSDEELLKLYKVMVHHMFHNESDYENLKWILSKVFTKCSLITKVNIIDEQFSNNCFNDIMAHMELKKEMTEIFNKLIASAEPDHSSVLIVFLQSPQRVYEKILNSAAESSKQCDIMLEVMSLLKKYSNHCYESDTEPCIIRIIQAVFNNILNVANIQQDYFPNSIKNFVKFVSHLKLKDIISASKLLLSFIMPNLYKALVNNNIVNIKAQLDFLYLAYKTEELLEYRTPMLAMFAQTLDAIRWRIDTFVPVAPDALELAIDLQKKLFDTYNNDVIPDEEAIWLKCKLKHLHILNAYHYRKLWNLPGTNFFEVITGGSLLTRAVEYHHLASWLSKVLCSCCRQEWYEIWNCLQSVFGDDITLGIIQCSLSILMLTEMRNRTPSTWSCIRYCIENLIMIIRYKYLKVPLTNSQVKVTVHNIAAILNLVEDDTIPDIISLLLPLFMYILQRNKDYDVNIAQCLRKKLRSSHFSMVFNKIFSNGSTQ